MRLPWSCVKRDFSLTKRQLKCQLDINYCPLICDSNIKLIEKIKTEFNLIYRISRNVCYTENWQTIESFSTPQSIFNCTSSYPISNKTYPLILYKQVNIGKFENNLASPT